MDHFRSNDRATEKKATIENRLRVVVCFFLLVLNFVLFLLMLLLLFCFRFHSIRLGNCFERNAFRALIQQFKWNPCSVFGRKLVTIYVITSIRRVSLLRYETFWSSLSHSSSISALFDSSKHSLNVEIHNSIIFSPLNERNQQMYLCLCLCHRIFSLSYARIRWRYIVI